MYINAFLILISAAMLWIPVVMPVQAAAGHSLAGTTWRLIHFQSMDDSIGTLRPQDPSLYTMSLNRDGSVTMRLDCNRAKGDWSARPGAPGNSGNFRFTRLVVTRAICPPPSMGKRIIENADYIRSYLIMNDKLYLSLMADAGIYAWELYPAGPNSPVPAAPEDGGPRNWQVKVSTSLNLRAEPSTAARIIHRYLPGTILDNLGCRRAEDRIWCDVQQLGGGPRGFVAAEYLHPAVAPNGRAMTGFDDSALRAGQANFDATGKLPCWHTGTQQMTQCQFGVARAGGGYATVVIEKPDGGSRAIFFRMGIPVSADSSEADGYPELRATREADSHLISVGSERYEIPDAVVLGG